MVSLDIVLHNQWQQIASTCSLIESLNVFLPKLATHFFLNLIMETNNSSTDNASQSSYLSDKLALPAQWPLLAPLIVQTTSTPDLPLKFYPPNGRTNAIDKNNKNEKNNKTQAKSMPAISRPPKMTKSFIQRFVFKYFGLITFVLIVLIVVLIAIIFFSMGLFYLHYIDLQKDTMYHVDQQ